MFKKICKEKRGLGNIGHQSKSNKFETLEPRGFRAASEQSINKEDGRMKKTYKIEVDCANCALKMEEATKTVEGVQDATVSFMTQKMSVDADDDRFEVIMDEIVKVCKKVEPDCVILR